MTDRRARELEQQPDVQRALRHDTAYHPVYGRRPVHASHKVWLGAYLLILLGLGVLYYVLRLDLFHLHAVLSADRFQRYMPLARRVVVGAMAIVLALAVARLVSGFAIARIEDDVTRYNLRRILRLVVYVVLAVIAVSVLFANWYAALASVGLVSVVLGFALQTPVTSFIGWLYILVREPYRVGDRISIGDATGDVIEVTYLDTTLWEVGGPYLSTDQPSGRLVKFPNANVLTSAVFNYSWPVFPYIWNEIRFQVAYDSDFAWVGQVMREVAEQELGEVMLERVRTFREILAKTPVDQLQVGEHPSFLLRINANTWVDATVRYLVEPRQAGRTMSRMIGKMLARLNEHPERVRFPKGDSR